MAHLTDIAYISIASHIKLAAAGIINTISTLITLGLHDQVAADIQHSIGRIDRNGPDP